MELLILCEFHSAKPCQRELGSGSGSALGSGSGSALGLGSGKSQSGGCHELGPVHDLLITIIWDQCMATGRALLYHGALHSTLSAATDWPWGLRVYNKPQPFDVHRFASTELHEVLAAKCVSMEKSSKVSQGRGQH